MDHDEKNPNPAANEAEPGALIAQWLTTAIRAHHAREDGRPQEAEQLEQQAQTLKAAVLDRGDLDPDRLDSMERRIGSSREKLKAHPAFALMEEAVQKRKAAREAADAGRMDEARALGEEAQRLMAQAKIRHLHTRPKSRRRSVPGTLEVKKGKEGG